MAQTVSNLRACSGVLFVTISSTVFFDLINLLIFIPVTVRMQKASLNLNLRIMILHFEENFSHPRFENFLTNTRVSLTSVK